MSTFIRIQTQTIVILLLTGSCGETPEPYDEPLGEDGGDLIWCETAGGTCTESPSAICDPGYQPLTANDPKNTDCIGHCCVEADQNTCNDELEWTCIPDACTGGWQAVEGLTICEVGRVCCFWAN